MCVCVYRKHNKNLNFIFIYKKKLANKEKKTIKILTRVRVSKAKNELFI